jgi:hypothetical protein
MPGDSLTLFLVQNVLDIPEIYGHICYKIFPNEKDKLLPLLEQLSYVNILVTEIADEMCDILETKSLKNVMAFLGRVPKRQTSIFRYDPISILKVYLNHQDLESATYFLRYVLHTNYLPKDMNMFLETYSKSEYRNELIPKVIYSWYTIPTE